MQGGIYLLMKTDGELHDRIERALPRLMIAFFVLNTLVVLAMIFYEQDITSRYRTDPWLVDLPGAGVGRTCRGLASWSAGARPSGPSCRRRR